MCRFISSNTCFWNFSKILRNGETLRVYVNVVGRKTDFAIYGNSPKPKAVATFPMNCTVNKNPCINNMP